MGLSQIKAFVLGRANSAAPTTQFADGANANWWMDPFGRGVVSDLDPEWGVASALTNLRERVFAQRYTVLADSIADGLASWWTTTNANGGTATSSAGEGLIQTSTATNGSSQIVSLAPNYFPGQVSWLLSAMRLGDTGTAGNIRRWGAFTVSGTTPQDGAYFELNGTTLNAVTVKAGVTTTVAMASWSRNAAAPFTLDLNYHQWEIRWTSNSVYFLIDNVLRHSASGGATSITTTLNFPMCLQNIKTSGATNIVLAVRNIGIGRFGHPDFVPVAGDVIISAAPTFTRPADVLQYAIGDTVANSTTAGSVTVLQFAGAARNPGGSGMIRRAKIKKSNTSVTSAQFRLHLWTATVTVAAGDNVAFSTSGAATYLGSIDISVDRAFTDGATGFGTPREGAEINFELPTGVIIYGLLEARATYTPTSGETFDVSLEILPN